MFQIGWDFFDSLDEMVYITDMSTNTLVYMNAKTRNAIGFNQSEQYVGKLCYEVLQGLSAPCQFCTNHLLEEGKFYAWSYFNPVMNTHFSIHDTMLIRDGKSYRLEIAVSDKHSKQDQDNSHYYAHNEMIIGECLKHVFSSTNAEDAISRLLAYIGEKFLCERVYIFEVNDRDNVDNTYEWCSEGVIPQKDILQNEPFEGVAWWFDMFQKKDVLIIENLEDIRSAFPLTYSILKPQNIVSLAAGPIYDNAKTVGFIGVDNPDPAMLSLIVPLLKVIGYFILSLLKRRDLQNKLHLLSFHDQLTGVFNRNALFELYPFNIQMDCVGIIYCDISGLKKVNDTLGHSAGDNMIIQCTKVIQTSVQKKGEIYRIGGDEFIAICPNMDENEFMQQVNQLKLDIAYSPFHIAVGCTWSDQHPIQIEKLISKADQSMYLDKRDYYTTLDTNHQAQKQRRQELSSQASGKNEDINRFMLENSYDADAVFRSFVMTDTSHYLYFGDLRSNRFYISDNMRDTFGFSSNVVHDLINEWCNKIVMPEHRQIYLQDFAQMLQEKRTVHDLRYQVRDAHGAVRWIRCSGIMQWDEEMKTPIFFSGSISTQDSTFLIDPITNFPREQTALEQLKQLEVKNTASTILVFSLNHFTQMNEMKGRYRSNILLQNIAEKLLLASKHNLDFFRLDGLKFLAIVRDPSKFDCDQTVDQFRTLIEHEYFLMGLFLPNPCSFGIMKFPNDVDTPISLVENALLLLSTAQEHSDHKYVLYSPTSIDHMKRMANISVGLNQAVQNDMKDFYIAIQPMLSARDSSMVGGEVLLRWKYEGVNVSPKIFIPLLDEGNIVQTVGRWVFEETVRICRRIVVHRPDFKLSFNVSSEQIRDWTLLDFMDSTLQKYHVNGSNLIADLASSSPHEHPEQLATFVEHCNHLGIQVALDDSGTQSSSLDTLLRHPAHIVKLDRTILSEREDSTDLLYSIVYACHRAGKLVCMEGVETDKQHQLAVDAGCDLLQGFLYHKPMDPNDLYHLLV